MPDYAVINFHAEAHGETAASAIAGAKTRTAAIIATIDRAGVDNADRGAQHSNVQRRSHWNGQKEVFQGWSAQIFVSCTIREPEKAYALVEAVADSQSLNIDGPTWMVDAANRAHHEARSRAVEDARRKASSYAEAMGLTLGEVTELIEGASYDGGPMTARMTMESASLANVDPAAQQVAATVTMTFTIE